MSGLLRRGGIALAADTMVIFIATALRMTAVDAYGADEVWAIKLPK